MKPLIGVTSYESDRKGYHTINTNYINSVFDAGGIPVIIPIIPNEEDFEIYLSRLDGIIFSGGIDVSPLIYNENPLKEVNVISQVRDDYEMGLMKKAFEMNIPVLGVCRGHQLANVILGGTLYQDLNSQVPNVLGHAPKVEFMDEFYHSINIDKDSKLYEIMGEEKLFVNSLHHQAIKELGNNLKITAYSQDGIIEAIESTDDRFFIGVQFHPEALARRHPQFSKLFKALIDECNNKYSK